jgi:hypothetical protein
VSSSQVSSRLSLELTDKALKFLCVASIGLVAIINGMSHGGIHGLKVGYKFLDRADKWFDAL